MTSPHRTPILAIVVLLACGFLPVDALENSVDAGLRVHNLFQSNMVIQRAKPVDVWGWSQPGDKVTVTFARKSVSATADKAGKWLVQLPAMEASSTPAKMTIASSGGDEFKFKNIVIGDIWVLGGQSNMQWAIGATNEGNLEVASANFPKIRMLT